MRIVLAAALAAVVAAAAAGGQQPAAPGWPPAKYEAELREGVRVPMRDGVKLSTDLYFPKGSGERLPVIMIRTPYDKRAHRRPNSAAWRLAGQGYVVAVQDTRGKFESEGEYTISKDDVADGSDATTWLATQPWSNGKVGTYGCSYLGDTQVMQARVRNPHHAAMLPAAAGSSIHYRYFGTMDGGAIELSWVETGLAETPHIESESFGTQFIRTLIERQLKGSWTRTPADHGLSITLRWPIDAA